MMCLAYGAASSLRISTKFMSKSGLHGAGQLLKFFKGVIILTTRLIHFKHYGSTMPPL